jgi:hypothetical protein
MLEDQRREPPLYFQRFQRFGKKFKVQKDEQALYAQVKKANRCQAEILVGNKLYSIYKFDNEDNSCIILLSLNICAHYLRSLYFSRHAV